MAKGKTQTYYDKNPKAAAKKAKYQSNFNKLKEQVEKRVELNRENRKRGGYHDGYDLAHTKNGLVKKKPSANRGSKSDAPGDRRARGGKKK